MNAIEKIAFEGSLITQSHLPTHIQKQTHKHWIGCCKISVLKSFQVSQNILPSCHPLEVRGDSLAPFPIPGGMADKECWVWLKIILVVDLTYLSHCQRGHWKAVGENTRSDTQSRVRMTPVGERNFPEECLQHGYLYCRASSSGTPNRSW